MQDVAVWSRCYRVWVEQGNKERAGVIFKKTAGCDLWLLLI